MPQEKTIKRYIDNYERAKDIVRQYLKGYTKSAIAKEFGLSKQMIGHVIKQMLGKNSVEFVGEEEMAFMNQIRETFNLPSREIAERADTTFSTVDHIFCGTEAYMRQAMKNTAIVRIYKAIVQIAVEKLTKLEEIL